jgi:ATP-dependent Clp protease ATP-binding subunit ClpA
MLSRDLEVSLNLAFRDARNKRHEFMTVEHLLLACSTTTRRSKVLKACGIDMERPSQRSRRVCRETTPKLLPVRQTAKPSPRSAFSACCSGRSSMCSPPASGSDRRQCAGGHFQRAGEPGVYLLKSRTSGADGCGQLHFPWHYQGVAIRKARPRSGCRNDASSRSAAAVRAAPKSALAAYATNLNEQAMPGRIDPLVGRDA